MNCKTNGKHLPYQTKLRVHILFLRNNALSYFIKFFIVHNKQQRMLQLQIQSLITRSWKQKN